MNWDTLVRIMYSEKDFGRSVATTVAGVVGLAAYLLSSDWVIALFVAVIAFPLCRVTVTALHSRWKQKRAQILETIEAEQAFSKFSHQERQVIEFFVHSGGACVSWGAVNRSDLPFPRPALNSLMARGIVHLSAMENGTEAFQLDIDTFDTAQGVFSASNEAEPDPTHDARMGAPLGDSIPF